MTVGWARVWGFRVENGINGELGFLTPVFDFLRLFLNGISGLCFLNGKGKCSDEKTCDRNR